MCTFRKDRRFEALAIRITARLMGAISKVESWFIGDFLLSA